MTVTVRIFGGLSRYTAGRSELTTTVAAGTHAWDLVTALSIPLTEVWIVAVDGIKVDQEHVLKDGDRVDIFAPVGGG